MWVLDQKSEPLPLGSSFVAPSRYKRFEQMDAEQDVCETRMDIHASRFNVRGM